MFRVKYFFMLKIIRVSRRNPRELEEPARIYASAKHEASINLESLAQQIAKRCSLTSTDVNAALHALMEIVPDELLEGKIVTLGQLGSFCLSVRSEGVETPEQLSRSAIKGLKIQYRPGKELKKKLRMVEYTFVA